MTRRTRSASQRTLVLVVTPARAAGNSEAGRRGCQCIKATSAPAHWESLPSRSQGGAGRGQTGAGHGEIVTPGGGDPAHGSWAGLLELPAFGLFAAMVITTERSVDAFTVAAVDLGKQWMPGGSVKGFRASASLVTLWGYCPVWLRQTAVGHGAGGSARADLEKLFGQPVDLVPREGRHWVIRDQVLADAFCMRRNELYVADLVDRLSESIWRA
jgi:hypothetical protein